MTKDKALKLALEIALDKEYQLRKTGQSHMIEPVITAIREALAPTSTQCEVQPEQEPSITKEARGTLILHSGWDDLPNGTKFYTTPPKRQPLTDAIGAEPTEMIHKWRVLELIKEHTTPLPLTDELSHAAKMAIQCSYMDHGRRTVNEQAWQRLIQAVAICAHGTATHNIGAKP